MIFFQIPNVASDLSLRGYFLPDHISRWVSKAELKADRFSGWFAGKGLIPDRLSKPAGKMDSSVIWASRSLGAAGAANSNAFWHCQSHAPS